MNKVILTGNLASDVEKHETNSGIKIAGFRIAVQRRYKNADGQRETDFFKCNAFRQSAEFAQNYLNKGDKVCIIGSVQNRSFTNSNGQNVTATEINVDEIEILSSRRREEQTETAEQTMQRMEHVEQDDDLPF